MIRRGTAKLTFKSHVKFTLIELLLLTAQYCRRIHPTSARAGIEPYRNPQATSNTKTAPLDDWSAMRIYPHWAKERGQYWHHFHCTSWNILDYSHRQL